MLRHSITSFGRGARASHPATCTVFFGRSQSTVVPTQDDCVEVRPYHKIPGPKPLPLIGNVWRFLPIIGEFADADQDRMQKLLYRKYGSIVKLSSITGKRDMVFVFDPHYVETAYRNEGVWPVRDAFKSVPYYREVLRKDFFQGKIGITFAEGKVWQDFRSKVNQPMMQPRNAKQYVGPIDEVAGDLIKRMRDLRNDKGELPHNFMEELHRWALESISLVALDTRLGCLSADLKPDSKTQKMINAVHTIFDAMFALDFKPSIIPFTRRKEWKQLVEAFDLFNEVAMEHVQKSMDRIQDKDLDDERDLSVLEAILLKNDTSKEAVVMALDMMLAGIDTTSNATGTNLHHLARNQDKQERLFQEIKAILPSKNQPITVQNLEDMKYLKACIKESMRVSPTVSGNLRSMVKDVVIGNYHVPKGTDIIVGQKMINCLEEYFPKAEQYIPERWLKGDIQHKKMHPFTFLPFGFGPRMCIGQRFAQLEMETLIAKTIRNFRLEYDQELTHRQSTVTMISSPLCFRLEERAS